MEDDRHLDDRTNVRAARALDAAELARMVNPLVRIYLSREDGQFLSYDELRAFNISLGRDPDAGLYKPEDDEGVWFS